MADNVQVIFQVERDGKWVDYCRETYQSEDWLHSWLKTIPLQENCAVRARIENWSSSSMILVSPVFTVVLPAYSGEVTVQYNGDVLELASWDK